MPEACTSASCARMGQACCIALCRPLLHRFSSLWHPIERAWSWRSQVSSPGIGLPICALHWAWPASWGMPSLGKLCMVVRPKPTGSTHKRLLLCCALRGSHRPLSLPPRGAPHASCSGDVRLGCANALRSYPRCKIPTASLPSPSSEQDNRLHSQWRTSTPRGKPGPAWRLAGRRGEEPASCAAIKALESGTELLSSVVPTGLASTPLAYRGYLRYAYSDNSVSPPACREPSGSAYPRARLATQCPRVPAGGRAENPFSTPRHRHDLFEPLRASDGHESPPLPTRQGV